MLKKKSILKFLKSVNSRIPIENSKPARANKKKDIEYKFMSSFKLPLKTEIVYKTTHNISENNNIFKKFVLLKIKIIITNQKKSISKR